MIFKLLTAILLAAILFSPGRASGQELIQSLSSDKPAEPPKSNIYPLSITPAAESFPPLKYRLEVPYNSRKEGNAAQFYYRAILQLSQSNPGFLKKYGDKYHFMYSEWMTVPLKDLPKEEVRKWLMEHQSVLGELTEASLRDKCDWDFRLRDIEGIVSIAFLLPEIQKMRSLARILRVKSRLEIAEGRFDDAFNTIRMGYKMAQDVAEPPILVSDLVGIAIAQIMGESVKEWIEATDSPNLYWALVTLPDPLIDTRESMRFEMSWPWRMFPLLNNAETADLAPEQWLKEIAGNLRSLNSLSGAADLPSKETASQAVALGLLMKFYPTAKKELIAAGYSKEKVEAMPVGQVVAIQANRGHRYIYDEIEKWTLLPYWQLHQYDNAEEKLRKEGYFSVGGKEILPIAALLLPAVKAALAAQERGRQTIAALKTLEAIRMHAAQTGALPKSLENLQPVPAALDPFTGKSFPYRVKNGKAILEVFPLEKHMIEHVGRRYEITIAAPK